MGYYINYKVTNTDLFNSVDDVEFDLKCYERHFEGDVCIEINGDWKTITGEHGANDYVDEYGFQIVKEYKEYDTEDDEARHWNNVTTFFERHSYDD
tara:strand:- start:84 stop:371 length:288 start_codon:yes stop_codon:yes gene_type:complete